MKATFCGSMGLVGAAIAASLGGWDMALQTLCIFMAIDYVSGLIVAGIFQASTKSENGALESRAGLKGLLRKAAMLCAVLMDSNHDCFGIGYKASANSVYLITICYGSLFYTVHRIDGSGDNYWPLRLKTRYDD